MTLIAPLIEGKTIAVERTLKLEMSDFVLVGRVDRLVELGDGTLEIVDYKSRRKRVTAEDVANDLAMSCYQMLVRHAYPGRKWGMVVDLGACVADLKQRFGDTPLYVTENGAAFFDPAKAINGRVEDIGARRLATVMEKLLEEISFDAGKHGAQTLNIDAAYVGARLGELAQSEDLARYVL